MATIVGIGGELQHNMVGDITASTDPSTIISEFMRNGFEAPAATEDGSRTITWLGENVDGVMKLKIRNNCKGMSFEQLTKLANLAIKGEKGNSIQRNYGMGARISGLSASPYGLIYRSAHDGMVLEVSFRMIDAGNAQQMEMSDVRNVTKEYAYKADQEWTEVIFLGRNAKDDTVKEPWVGSLSYPTIQSITSRFFRYPDGVNVIAHKSSVSKNTYPQNTDNRNIKPMFNFMLDHFDRLESVVCEDNVVIHYGYNTNHGKITWAKTKPTGGIVYRNEIYSLKQNADWKDAANAVGLVDVGHTVNCFVELPDDYAVINDIHRSKVIYDDTKQTVKITDFEEEIEFYMPDWVRDIVSDAEKKRQESRSQEIEDMLMDLICDFAPKYKGVKAGRGDRNGGERSKVTARTGNGKTDKPVTDRHGKPKQKERLNGEGEESGREADLWMPKPDIEFVYEGHDRYDEMKLKPVHVVATKPEKSAQIYIKGDTDFIHHTSNQIKGLAMKGSKLDEAKVVATIKTTVERELSRLIGTAYIAAVSFTYENNLGDAVFHEAIKDSGMATHIYHLASIKSDMAKEIKRNKAA